MGIPNVVGDNVYAVDEYANVHQSMRDMMMTMQADAGEYKLVKDYFHGNHVLPNVPKTARVEVHQIAKRSTMNLIPLLVSIPAQISFVDGYRVGEDLAPQEWKVWERSGMASKQTACWRTALKYGNAFLALEDVHTKKPLIKLLSTSDTVAYYHDPVNDLYPVYAMTIRYRPSNDAPGLIVYYDDKATTYWEWHQSESGDSEFQNPRVYPHKLGVCPVGRVVCQMDDDGQVSGVVKPMIPLQDRVNQTAFDLLVTQTFSSFKVRWASGMLGDPVYEDEERTIPKVDADGNQVYRPIPIDQSTWVTTDDPAAKLGTLDETPLDGFIASFELAVKHFAVVGQLPPHNLLGPMQNVSADTLVAAMSQTQRFAHMLKTSWGQTVVNLMGLASVAMGLRDDLDDYDAEVRWRDMQDHTMAAVVDALGKAATMLDVPKKSLWQRFPGVTQGEVLEWEAAYDEQMELAFDGGVSPQDANARQAPDTGVIDSPPTPLEAFGQSTGR